MANAEKGLLRGSKISNNHSTLIGEAKSIVRAIKKDSRVNRIVLSYIIPKSGKLRLKIVHVPSGLKLTIRGHTAIQELYIYTEHASTVKKFILDQWDIIYPDAKNFGFKKKKKKNVFSRKKLNKFKKVKIDSTFKTETMAYQDPFQTQETNLSLALKKVNLTN